MYMDGTKWNSKQSIGHIYHPQEMQVYRVDVGSDHHHLLTAKISIKLKKLQERQKMNIINLDNLWDEGKRHQFQLELKKQVLIIRLRKNWQETIREDIQCRNMT